MKENSMKSKLHIGGSSRTRQCTKLYISRLLCQIYKKTLFHIKHTKEVKVR